MRYYKVLSGHELWHSGRRLGVAGDVVPLATDSEDHLTRKSAEAVLSGNWTKVAEVPKPVGGVRKKKTKKKASYKTRDAVPEPPSESASDES